MFSIGNTGLGKETAIKLASLGANVVILCKTPSKAEKAVDDIVREASALSKPETSIKVSYEKVDLADLKSIDKVSTTLKNKLQKIDVLVGRVIDEMLIPLTSCLM